MNNKTWRVGFNMFRYTNRTPPTLIIGSCFACTDELCKTYKDSVKKKFEGVHTIEIDIFRFAIERVLLIIRYMHISLKETNCASLLLFAVVLLWSYVKWWSTGIVSLWHRQRLLYLLGFFLCNIIFELKKKSFFAFHF